jgi:hypothetical protein
MSNSTTSHSETRRIPPPWLFPVLAILLAGAAAVHQVSHWPMRFRYPGEEDYIEGTKLGEMVDLRRGIPIYAPTSPERFEAANYGPLYYLLGARLVNVNQPAYLPLRLLSLAGTLALAVASGMLAFHLSQSVFAAILAPLLLLNHPFVARYGASARPDMVGLFLAFVGLIIAVRHRNSRAILLSAPWTLLSFFYKQQFLAVPLAILLFLLIEKRFRHALEYVGVMAAGELGMLAAFTWLVFPRQAFLQHFVTYNALPFDKNTLLEGSLVFGSSLLIPFAGSFKFLKRYPNPLVLYSMRVASYLALFVRTAGMDTNHFLECVAILTCLFAAHLATAKPFRSAAGSVASLGLCLLLFALLFVPNPTAQNFDQDKALQSYLRAHFPPGTKALGYYVGDLVRAGLDVPINNLWSFTQFVKMGKLSDRELQSQLEAGRFGLVLLDFDLRHPISREATELYTTESMRSAILGNYVLKASFPIPELEKTDFGNGHSYIWVPRAAASSRAGSQSGQNQ